MAYFHLPFDVDHVFPSGVAVFEGNPPRPTVSSLKDILVNFHNFVVALLLGQHNSRIHNIPDKIILRRPPRGGENPKTILSRVEKLGTMGKVGNIGKHSVSFTHFGGSLGFACVYFFSLLPYTSVLA